MSPIILVGRVLRQVAPASPTWGSFSENLGGREESGSRVDHHVGRVAERVDGGEDARQDCAPLRERDREFFIDNLLVRIYLIIEMTLVDRPGAMGV